MQLVFSQMISVGVGVVVLLLVPELKVLIAKLAPGLQPVLLFHTVVLFLRS